MKPGGMPAAYGLRLRCEGAGRWPGLGPAQRWLAVDGAERWPELVLAERTAPGPELSWDARNAALRVRGDVRCEELVHPLLGRAGAWHALHRGGDALHAGAFAGPCGAWLLIGAKGAGKSTLLASLAALGAPIVTDDVLVIIDGLAMAGPRCIDLRGDADRFGPTVAVRPEDPRRRLALPPIAAEHRLSGCLHLEWAECKPSIRLIEHREALRRLLALRADKGYPTRPQTLLALAALPSAVLTRPRGWASLERVAALAAELAGQGAPASGLAGGGGRGEQPLPRAA